MKKLEDGVRDLFTSENYKKYLRTMSQFHNYSFNNTILIALQRPDATYVAGYGAWQQKFHRQVKRGEKGITILAPVPVKDKNISTDETNHETTSHDPDDEKVTMYFRPVSVFDISQTDGEPLPTLGVDELAGSADGYASFMKALSTLSPVSIRFDEIDGGAKGYYHTVNKEIVIKSGMSEAQTMKTCVHEVSHAILHDRDRMKKEGVQKDRQTKEVEAESVAYAVCAAFGLDTGESYSFPYIGVWSGSKEMKELKASMDTIRKTAGEIIDGIESQYSMQKNIQKEQSNARPSLLAALDTEKTALKKERAHRKTFSEHMAGKQEQPPGSACRNHSGKETVL